MNPSPSANPAYLYNFQTAPQFQQTLTSQNMSQLQQQMQPSLQMPMQMQMPTQMNLQMPTQMQMQLHLQQQLMHRHSQQPAGFGQLPGQNSTNVTPFTKQPPSAQLYQSLQQQQQQSSQLVEGDGAIATSNPQGMTGSALVGAGFNTQSSPSPAKKDIWAAQQANLQSQLNKNNLNAGMISGGKLDVTVRKDQLVTSASTAESTGSNLSNAVDETPVIATSSEDSNASNLSSDSSLSTSTNSNTGTTVTSPIPPMSFNINSPVISTTTPIATSEPRTGVLSVPSSIFDSSVQGLTSLVSAIPNARLQKKFQQQQLQQQLLLKQRQQQFHPNQVPVTSQQEHPGNSAILSNVHQQYQHSQVLLQQLQQKQLQQHQQLQMQQRNAMKNMTYQQQQVAQAQFQQQQQQLQQQHQQQKLQLQFQQQQMLAQMQQLKARQQQVQQKQEQHHQSQSQPQLNKLATINASSSSRENLQLLPNVNVLVVPAKRRAPIDLDIDEQVVKILLEFNRALLRVCIDYQRHHQTLEPDYKLYQRRLQSILSYLASWEETMKNASVAKKSPPKPDLSPLPPARFPSAIKAMTLLSRVTVAFSNAQKRRATLESKVAADQNLTESASSSGLLNESVVPIEVIKEPVLITPTTGSESSPPTPMPLNQQHSDSHSQASDTIAGSTPVPQKQLIEKIENAANITDNQITPVSSPVSSLPSVPVLSSFLHESSSSSTTPSATLASTPILQQSETGAVSLSGSLAFAHLLTQTSSASAMSSGVMTSIGQHPGISQTFNTPPSPSAGASSVETSGFSSPLTTSRSLQLSTTGSVASSPQLPQRLNPQLTQSVVQQHDLDVFRNTTLPSSPLSDIDSFSTNVATAPTNGYSPSGSNPATVAQPNPTLSGVSLQELKTMQQWPYIQPQQTFHTNGVQSIGQPVSNQPIGQYMGQHMISSTTSSGQTMAMGTPMSMQLSGRHMLGTHGVQMQLGSHQQHRLNQLHLHMMQQQHFHPSQIQQHHSQQQQQMRQWQPQQTQQGQSRHSSPSISSSQPSPTTFNILPSSGPTDPSKTINQRVGFIGTMDHGSNPSPSPSPGLTTSNSGSRFHQEILATMPEATQSISMEQQHQQQAQRQYQSPSINISVPSTNSDGLSKIEQSTQGSAKDDSSSFQIDKSDSLVVATDNNLGTVDMNYIDGVSKIPGLDIGMTINNHSFDDHEYEDRKSHNQGLNALAHYQDENGSGLSGLEMQGEDEDDMMSGFLNL
ncbi:hypothetical protein BGZ49_001873 [Haplosporangium sp. Z 27]|nr:hypothetical protein BGZ49_001873 [Haplosporangium sp. Z 27]